MLPEKKAVTLKDVAKHAGASLASVSVVLSGSDKRYVSEELRQRVLTSAKELNYVKSVVATGLRGGSQRVIALLIPQFENSFFTRLAISVERVVNRHDYTLLICNTNDDEALEAKIVKKMVGHRVDGIILSPTAEGRENTELVRQYNIPYVVADRPLKGMSGYDLVTMDDYQAGYDCAKEFLAHGHRRFGYIGWQTSAPVSSRRQRGFEDVIRGAAERFECVAAEGYARDYGYRATQKLFERAGDITAVLYGHHLLAIGGVSWFREAGIAVPKDLSVILIGSPEWVQVAEPAYTCVYQPIEEIGELAAQMLFDKIEGNRSIQETRMLQCRLIRGESVAGPNK